MRSHTSPSCPRTRGRGRFLLLYELVFPVGLVAAVLVGAWLVPNLGWQSLFVVGAFPALIVFFMQRLLPESPRWLATHGRYAEADAVLTTIEKSTERSTKRSLPPPQPVVTAQERSASFADLFGPQYLKRTLTSWAIWSCCYFCTFGLATWLPSIYRSVFQLSVSDALSYSVVTQVVGLGGCLVCALSIDLVRRDLHVVRNGVHGRCSHVSLALGGQPKLANHRHDRRVARVFFINFISIGVYLFTPGDISHTRPCHRSKRQRLLGAHQRPLSDLTLSALSWELGGLVQYFSALLLPRFLERSSLFCS